MNESRRNILFPNVSDQDWNDWHWQVRNRIETLDELKKYVQLTEEEQEGVRSVLSTLRMAITPYYLSLINPDDPHDPIRKQCIPTAAETHKADADLLDPLHEDEDSPVPGLTHRYPDRVLFLITDMCSMYCRHCTRRRFAGQKDDESPLERIEKALAYIEKTECVRDVLLSGGDALMVSDKRLEYIISRLRAIPHVEIVRIGSRVPVVCPQRITPELCAMLSKYHPIWLNTHFNHPNEVTQESRRACEMHARASVLPVSVRPEYGSGAFPYARLEGYRDHRRPARPYLRLLRAHLRGGRPGRWWQDTRHAAVYHLAGSRPRGAA